MWEKDIMWETKISCRNKNVKILLVKASFSIFILLFLGLLPTGVTSAAVNPVSCIPGITIGAHLGGRIEPTRLALKKREEKFEYSILTADVTNTRIVTASNTFNRKYPVRLENLIIALLALQETEPDEEIVITEAAAKQMRAEACFQDVEAGSVITAESIITAYLITWNEGCRQAIMEYIGGDESGFYKIFDRLAGKLNVNREDYEDVIVCDLYLVLYELLQYDLFIHVVEAEEETITYHTPEGDLKEAECYKEGRKLPNVNLPEGFRIIGDINHVLENDRTGQIILLADERGQYYLTILMGLAERADLSQTLEYTFNSLSSKIIIRGEQPLEEVVPIEREDGLPVPTESNDARYRYLFGTDASVFSLSNLPNGYKNSGQAARNMTTISVRVWKMNQNGTKYSSKYNLTINKKLAESVQNIFDEIYALKMQFPIKYMIGYSYRKVGGVGLVNSKLMSIHSFGAAIDINPGDYDNDYFLGYGNDLRNKSNPYCIPDEVIEIFERNGWFWGGNFKICADTMHFQYLGLEFLDYGPGERFPVLSLKTPAMSGSVVSNLQGRLVKLGYLQYSSGSYNLQTELAVKEFQKDYRLSATGVVDYDTWVKIINLTHYMSYVF